MSPNETKCLEFVAPNGVRWTRRRGGRSTGPMLLEALETLAKQYDVVHTWDWWQEGRRDKEDARAWRVLEEWDNGAPQQSPEETDAAVRKRFAEWDKKDEEARQHRADLVAQSYDRDRELLRLRLLRVEADAAFFGHVIAKPASQEQLDEALNRQDTSRTEAEDLRREIGDPEEVIDSNGYFPAERREVNLRSHSKYWRHPSLRKLSKTNRRRFNALLKMPPPTPEDMCSECEAPSLWHEFDLSLCLFRQPPPADSQAATIARLMPGWWERCSACTAYKIAHQWGGKQALPDFDGEQWRAMLPPLLKKLFTNDKPKPPAPKPEPLAIIAPGSISDVMERLAQAQAKYPDAELRRGKGSTWELWPT